MTQSMTARQTAPKNQSHSGLQPKGDYDHIGFEALVDRVHVSHSGLQPKGDYDDLVTGMPSMISIGVP